MKLKTFQEIDKIDKSLPQNEYNKLVIEALNYNIDELTKDEVSRIVKESFNVPDKPLKKVIKLGGKKYKYDNDMLKITFGQWIQMEQIMSLTNEDNYTQYIHKILAIFLRETKWNGKIKPFNSDDIDVIAKNIQENMDVNVAIKLGVFFYHNASEYMRRITKILYLQDQMKMVDQHMQNKSKK